MSYPSEIKSALQLVIYQSPFLAHLVMALRWRMDATGIDTACTDGVEVRVNPKFFAGLTSEERGGLLAHEALHAALRHCERSRSLVQTPADAALVNVVCDIVVNGALVKAGMVLPGGAIRDKKREHMSVEEIYRALKKTSRASKMGCKVGAKLRDLDLEGAAARVDNTNEPGDAGEAAEGEVDWQAVIRRADMLARRQGGLRAGSSSLDITRELNRALGVPSVDWRSVLWRFLAETPSDWGGFDRRHVWNGVYLPKLEGQRLRAVVGIDVSGSVHDRMLTAFLTELSGILGAVANLEIDLFWTDTKIHGPVRLTARSDLLALKRQGGGGTDLAPLFLAAQQVAHDEGVQCLPCIYLTDGLGRTLSEEPPGVSALWVIPEGGRMEQPWGTVVPLEVAQ